MGASDENALYTIHYDGGTTSGTLRVNQRNADYWQELVKTTELNGNAASAATTISVNDLGQAPRVGAKFILGGDLDDMDPQIYTVAAGSTATSLVF